MTILYVPKFFSIATNTQLLSQARDGCKRCLSTLEFAKDHDLKDIMKFNEGYTDLRFVDGIPQLFQQYSVLVKMV